MDFPEKSWAQISQMQQKYNFEGEYKCTLCPKKVLYSKSDLTDHLASIVRLNKTIIYHI